jgi:dihydroorotase-like cyclic amidohydrolase
MLRSLLELYARGRLKEARLVEVFSTKAAEFYGIGSSFGQLKPGRPFNAVWLDPKAPRRPIELSDLYSKSKNNVFLGRSLPGALLGTFLGERIHLF